jgi:hypothetical protein
MLIRLLPALLAAVVLGLGAHALSSHAAEGVPLLPDLDQEVPAKLVVTLTGERRKPTYVLGFRSAVGNIGDGPLIISGHRPDRGTGAMIADQEIVRRGGPQGIERGVGHLRYVVPPHHRHGHLLGSARPARPPPGGAGGRVRAPKTGFCLGDRYTVTGHALAARAPAPVYTSRCGLGEPARLGISEGISVGYGDDYAANLEGQYLPLSGLAAGRYELVHRVNADRRLHELSYANNAASLLLDLRWKRGVPQIRVLASCPDSARCKAPR